MSAVTLLAGSAAGAAAPPAGKGKPQPSAGFDGAYRSASCWPTSDELCRADATADASTGLLAVDVAAGHDGQDVPVPAPHRRADGTAAVSAYRSTTGDVATWQAVVRVHGVSSANSGGTARHEGGLVLTVPGGESWIPLGGLAQQDYTLTVTSTRTSGTASVRLFGVASNGAVGVHRDVGPVGVRPDRVEVGGRDVRIWYVPLPWCGGYSGFPPCSVWVPHVASANLPATGLGRAEVALKAQVLSLTVT